MVSAAAAAAAAVAALVAVSVVPRESSAYMLTPHSSCPGGLANGNGTTFTLEKLFQYPVHFTIPMPLPENPKRTYEYWVDPCGSAPCPNAVPNGDDVAVCQRADQHYNAGALKNVQWVFNGNYMNTGIDITYGAAYEGSWRSTVLHVIATNDWKGAPNMTFTGESPFLQYNFDLHVNLKDIIKMENTPDPAANAFMQPIIKA